MKRPSAKTKKPLTIMVLDDNALWRQLVRSIIESDLGISPFLAANGKEAFDILDARQIDVVVSDLNMPVMSGIQFLQKARRLHPKTKVIIVSATVADSPTVSEELINQGAFAVISKLEVATSLISLLRTLKKSK